MNESETIADLRGLLAHHGVPDFTVGTAAAPGSPELIRQSLEALNRRVQRDTTCGATVEVDLAGGRVQYSAEEGDTTFKSAWFVFPFLAEGISDALIELEDRAYQAWTLAHPDTEPETLCPKCGSSRFHPQAHEVTGEDLSYSVCATCGFEQGYDRESGALDPERD